MPKRKKTKKSAAHGTARCIATMIDRITVAESLASTAEMLLKKGQHKKAFEVALDIEPFLHEANHLLQAACVFRASRLA